MTFILLTIIIALTIWTIGAELTIRKLKERQTTLIQRINERDKLIKDLVESKKSADQFTQELVHQTTQDWPSEITF